MTDTMIMVSKGELALIISIAVRVTTPTDLARTTQRGLQPNFHKGFDFELEQLDGGELSSS